MVGVDGSAVGAGRGPGGGRGRPRSGSRPLRVVHAFIWPLTAPRSEPSTGARPTPGLRNQAEQIVAEAVAEASKVAPERAVTGEVVDGAPTPVLLRESRDAALLVLGPGAWAASPGCCSAPSAVQVSARARLPGARGARRGSAPTARSWWASTARSCSTEAVGFAFEEAAAAGHRLLAVHAWLYPTPVGPGDVLPLAYDVDALAAEEERALAEAVAGWSPSATPTCRCSAGWSGAPRRGCWWRSRRRPS